MTVWFNTAEYFKLSILRAASAFLFLWQRVAKALPETCKSNRAYSLFSYIAVVFVCLLFFTKAFCSDSLNACMHSNISIHFSPVGMIAALSPHLVLECIFYLVAIDVCLFSLYLGPMHSQLEFLSDSWARLKHSRDWLCNSSYSFESDFDLTKSLGIHTLIENVVSFVSGDVGNAPGFKEPEESMSTSPQASIIAMEQQQLRAEVSFDIYSS